MTEKQKILIVDDKKENLFALRTVLAGVDAEIVEATSGNKALAATLDHHFAVAILDVMMPGMNGFELAEHLRGDVKTREIPLIFLTAASDEYQMFQGYEVGGIDYIVKPYAPEIVLCKVKIFLELDRHKRELQLHRDHLETLVAKGTAKLPERIKEIECLYSLSRLFAEPDGSINESLRAAVDLIPAGLQHPESTCVRITFEGRDFTTPNFRDTACKHSADIVLSGKTVGMLEVYYHEENRPCSAGPHRENKRRLITDIARQLGIMISRARAEKILSIRSRIAETFLTCPEDNIFNESLKIVLEVMESEFGILGFLDENGDLVVPSMTTRIWDACKIPDKDIVFTREKWGNSTWQRVILEKKTFCVNDPSANLPDGHLSIHRHIALPLIQRGEVVGLLMVANKQTDYSKLAVEYMETIAQVITPLLAATAQRKRLNQQRRLAEERMRLMRTALELLNRSTDRSNIINDILTLIKESMGFDAVGIRLQHGDDFPYFVTQGFSKEFVRAENYLCERDEKGGIVRDVKGNPVLECMCGNVLRGRTDPKLPFFTQGGSFWTNSTTKLLASTTERERQSRTRNRCHREGYESVALIPLRAGVKVIGLLQLTDRRRDCFTPEMICFFEGLGVNLGIAFSRRDMAARYKSLFDGSMQGILVTDVGTKQIKFANPAFLKMFEYSEEELIQVDAKDIHLKELLDNVNADQARAPGLKSLSHGLAYQRKDGGVIFIDIVTSTVEIGGRTHNMSFFTDITGHKKMEEQFIQTQKLEAVGRLAGGVAHDFNNLLTVILGYGDALLCALNPEDPLREDIEQIMDAGKRAANLTRQLLAFSRKQALQPEVLNLNAVVEDLAKMLMRVIGEDIEFTTALDADLGRIKADPGQIEQIIMNLVVNARDSMPNGGKLIIETANVELDKEYSQQHLNVAPGQYVMLGITDTGCGMDQETKSRLFEPFYTTKEKDKGTGLGLSTVYGIVKQSGGNIWIYSEPGMGTTFKIYLPRTEDEPIAEAELPKEEKLRGNDERVLLVEDDPALRDLFEKMLAILGYRVTVAANGGEALIAVEENGLRPDLLITDMVMPGMNGAVLADRLRKIQPDLKVLFMSGYIDDSIVQHNILDPNTPFIQKPFTRDVFASKIDKVLRGWGELSG